MSPFESKFPQAELPFIVRAVRTEDDLRKAISVRARSDADRSGDGASAAGRGPGSPDEYDLQPNTLLLLAESRVDGEPLGSLRIMINDRGRLCVEQLVALPSRLHGLAVAEASRLAVRSDRGGTVVRMMLWKAFHRYCLAAQIHEMLIAPRLPEDRLYESLGFGDVVPQGLRFSVDGAAQPTHRLMSLGVFEAQRHAAEVGHPLYDFFFVERHTEIEIFASVASRWNAPRSGTQLPDHARIAAQLEQLAII